MRKLWNKIPTDKRKHFIWGMWLSLAMLYSIPLGYLFVLSFAVGKEYIHDHMMKKGTFEWLDIVATMIAPTIVLIITLL